MNKSFIGFTKNFYVLNRRAVLHKIVHDFQYHFNATNVNQNNPFTSDNSGAITNAFFCNLQVQ